MSVEIPLHFINWLILQKAFTQNTAKTVYNNVQTVCEKANINAQDIKNFTNFFHKIDKYVQKKYQRVNNVILMQVKANVSDEDENEHSEFRDLTNTENAQTELNLSKLYSIILHVRYFIQFQFQRDISKFQRLSGKLSNVRTKMALNKKIHIVLQPYHILTLYQNCVFTTLSTDLDDLYTKLIQPFLLTRYKDESFKKKIETNLIPLLYVLVMLETPISNQQFIHILPPFMAKFEYLTNENLSANLNQDYFTYFFNLTNQSLKNTNKFQIDFLKSSDQTQAKEPRFFLSKPFERQNTKEKIRILRITLKPYSSLTSNLLFFYFFYCHTQNSTKAFTNIGKKRGELTLDYIKQYLDKLKIAQFDNFFQMLAIAKHGHELFDQNIARTALNELSTTAEFFKIGGLNNRSSIKHIQQNIDGIDLISKILTQQDIAKQINSTKAVNIFELPKHDHIIKSLNGTFTNFTTALQKADKN